MIRGVYQTLPSQNSRLSWLINSREYLPNPVSSIAQFTDLSIVLRYIAVSLKHEIQLIKRSINADGFFAVFSVSPGARCNMCGMIASRTLDPGNAPRGQEGWTVGYYVGSSSSPRVEADT